MSTLTRVTRIGSVFLNKKKGKKLGNMKWIENVDFQKLYLPSEITLSLSLLLCVWGWVCSSFYPTEEIPFSLSSFLLSFCRVTCLSLIFKRFPWFPLTFTFSYAESVMPVCSISRCSFFKCVSSNGDIFHSWKGWIFSCKQPQLLCFRASHGSEKLFRKS